MDLKTLKLELLERIALLDDELRLLALKRLLDAPRGYGIPNEHLTVVQEGGEPYIKLEDRNYTAEEVRKLVRDILQAGEPQQKTFANSPLPEERNALDHEGERADKDQGSFHTIEE